MNRRETIVMLASVAFMGADGCPRQKSLDDLVSTLGNAIALLLSVNGNPQLAAKIRADTDSIVALIRVWKEGQDPSEIIRAINILINDIKTLPVPPNYLPLINLTLGTLASIIEHLNQRGGGHEKPDTNVRLTAPPKTSDEFKHAWDSIRAGSPNMHDAPVL